MLPKIKLFHYDWLPLHHGVFSRKLASSDKLQNTRRHGAGIEKEVTVIGHTTHLLSILSHLS